MSAFETVEEFVLLVAKYCCLLIECIGLGILVISAVKALIGILSSKKDNVRLKLMEGISTALEFLLCGEVIKTITSVKLESMLYTAAVMLLRAAMTVLLHWEIKNEEKHPELSFISKK